MVSSQRAFPGGRYRISREENLALCAAVEAQPDPAGRAHPIFYYIASQSAMGLSVAELCALCDFDIADGPMITQSNVVFDGEMLVDREYVVSGEIVSLVRKPSRTFGAVDLLTFNLQLEDADGGICATCTNQWVLPRRDGATA
jgi:hypothetical protein